MVGLFCHSVSYTGTTHRPIRQRIDRTHDDRSLLRHLPLKGHHRTVHRMLVHPLVPYCRLTVRKSSHLDLCDRRLLRERYPKYHHLSDRRRAAEARRATSLARAWIWILRITCTRNENSDVRHIVVRQRYRAILIDRNSSILRADDARLLDASDRRLLKSVHPSSLL